MAVPMTSSAFRNVVESALNKVFDEVYATHTSNEQHMVEVEFDGQDEIQVRNNRNDDDV
jgi:hypothetical protein